MAGVRIHEIRSGAEDLTRSDLLPVDNPSLGTRSVAIADILKLPFEHIDFDIGSGQIVRMTLTPIPGSSDEFTARFTKL